jgi:hypothetical protein
MVTVLFAVKLCISLKERTQIVKFDDLLPVTLDRLRHEAV